MYYIIHGDTLIVALYADDLVLTGNNGNLVLGLKRQFVDTFEIIDLGLFHFFLGIQVLQMDDGIFISQPKYALDILKWFKMDEFMSCDTNYQSEVKLLKDCDSPWVNTTLYRQLIDSFIYFTHSRPNLPFVVNVVSRFMQDPRESHWKVAKKIVHYIKGTY